MLRQKICGRFVGKGDICCGCSPGQLTKSRRGKAALAVVPAEYALLHVRKAYATPCFYADHGWHPGLRNQVGPDPEQDPIEQVERTPQVRSEII
jgi:hypothetical protein